MSKHKHTSGQWSIPHFALTEQERKHDDFVCDCQCRYILSENFMGAIATVHCADGENLGDDPLPEEAIANARLIAAAPNLLESLESILESAYPNPIDNPKMFAAWENAKSVISKIDYDK
jgi:hypothetical protein